MIESGDLMELTDEQKRVVNAKEKYIMVIAGAGCGKTSTIIKRVEYLINNGVDPKKILIISFTNNTVNDLVKRLNGIKVLTFHKLAIEILDNNTKKIITDNDLRYLVFEYFKYNLSKKDKRMLQYYLDYDFKNFNYFCDRIISLINIYKANDGSRLKIAYLFLNNYFNKKERYFLILFYQFINFYNQELNSYGAYDFNDLIIKAAKSRQIIKYDYVIVDEFQDTSKIRLKLLKKIIDDNNASLMVVGDDYQSIYQFSGSNLGLFVNLKDYFPRLKIYYFTNTFRNAYELVMVAGKFIMKNPYQLKKKMHSSKHLKQPIVIVYYRNLEKCVNKLIDKLGNPMILGRNQKDNLGFPNFYTVHASKGLESDNVIVINNRNDYLGFPNQVINDKISTNLINFKEIKYAEERRLFYVALTRTKNVVYLLVKRQEESVFINELLNDYQKYIKIMEE